MMFSISWTLIPAVRTASVPSYKELKYPPLRPIVIPKVDTYTLPSGLRIYLLEDHELPLVHGLALVRTGNLYLSIGLHAGWIFGLKVIRVFGDFRRQDLGWIFGDTDPKVVSGIATWIGVILVGVAVHLLTRRDSRLQID